MLDVAADFGEVFGRWRTWFLLGNQDIYLRYKRSVIGPFWISISLGAMILGMSLLFSQIYLIEFKDYLYWLAVSFLVWMLISGMMTETGSVLAESESPLRNVRISQPTLVSRMVYRNFLIFLHNALVVAAVIIIFGYRPDWSMLWALPGLAVLLLMGFLYAISMSALCLRFRDISQVVSSILQIAFFLTPIIWQPSQGRVSAEFVLWNPFYHLIELVRAPLLGGAPTLLNYQVSLGVVAVLAVTSLFALALTRRRVFLWL